MAIVEQLKRHEGFSARPYQCAAGVWTFGHGFTYITEEESTVVLTLRVEEIRLQMMQIEPFPALTTRRQEVLINMCFNLGLRGLLGFKKMWAALLAKDYDAAADQMLDSKWSSQVGQRAVELAGLMRVG